MEVGPGEGDLAADVWAELHQLNPLVGGSNWCWWNEILGWRAGSEVGHRSRAGRWTTLDNGMINSRGRRGSVLDAFPVERLIWRDEALRQMGVALTSDDAGQSAWDDRML